MSYPGSKGQAGVWQRIIGQMPVHSVYVEPFAGTGKVFFEKRRAESSILIDANPRAVQALSAKVGAAAGVRVLLGNALRLLPDLFTWLPSDVVCYCDPPYLLSTRTKQLLYQFGGESDEMTDADHAALLKVLLEAKCRVLVSGYPSELYRSSLRQWRCVEYDTMTRGGKRRECLWCNFPEPAVLHDWRFAGFNYRQRWTLKRFVRRWLARVDAMPARRRGYVLHELEAALAERNHGNDLARRDLATLPLRLVATSAASGERRRQ